SSWSNAEIRPSCAVAIFPLARVRTTIACEGVPVVALLARINLAIAALGAVRPIGADPARIYRPAIRGAGAAARVVALLIPLNYAIAALGTGLPHSAVPAGRDRGAVVATSSFIAFAFIAHFARLKCSAPAPRTLS